MLSIIHATEVWRHYLEGAKYEFEVWNNHANLQWFMKRQNLNRRQAHWAQWLSCFNFKWVHKPGASMAKANALSQREDHAIGIEENNKGILFISPEQIHAVSTWITDTGDCIQDQIREYTKAHDLAERYKNYDEENGILCRDGKIFVPDDDNLRMEIVHLHHDIPLAGHPG